MGEAPRVARRTVPGTDRTVSELGIALDPGPAAGPASDAQAVRALRRARAEGVTLFDVSGARSPARAAGLLRTAFPQSGPELVVMVGLVSDPAPAPSGPRSPRTPPAPGGLLSAADVEGWLATLRPRLPTGAAILPELPTGPREGNEGRSLPSVLGSLAERRSILTFSTRLERDALLRSGVGDVPSPIVSSELSLLDAPSLRSLAALASAPPHGLIVRDPFAGGRLDGTLVRATMGDRHPGRPPREVRELREEFAPVLRLGFLTRARTRTLAQAALRYLLQRPGTVSVLIPPPAPERWEEVFASVRAPPLDEEELARLEGGAPLAAQRTGARGSDGK